MGNLDSNLWNKITIGPADRAIRLFPVRSVLFGTGGHPIRADFDTTNHSRRLCPVGIGKVVFAEKTGRYNEFICWRDWSSRLLLFRLLVNSVIYRRLGGSYNWHIDSAFRKGRYSTF